MKEKLKTAMVCGAILLVLTLYKIGLERLAMTIWGSLALGYLGLSYSSFTSRGPDK